MSTDRRRPALALLALCGALAAACHQDMRDQPRYDPLEPSAFFDDGRASRPLVEGTVARGHLEPDAVFRTGRAGEGWTRESPVPTTAALLRRGRERYDVFCSPCHDRAGTGDGMIVRRGFRRPPSLHEARLREVEDGHLFDVVTNGFALMPSYAAQVPAADRWAIVAYVRALQLSQHARLEDVPPAERARLAAEAAR